MNGNNLQHLLSIFVLPLSSALIFVCCTIYTWRIHKNIFSPPVIHGLGWLLPAILTAVPHPFPYTLQPITWAAIFISYLSFFLGYSLAIRVKVVKHRNFRRIIGDLMVWDRHTFRLILTSLFLVFLFAFVLNLTNLIREKGIYAYFDVSYRIIEITFGGISPIINYLYFLNGLIILLSVIYIRAFQRDRFIILIGGISLVSTVFFGHKSAIILPVVLATSAYYCTQLRVDVRSTLVTIAIVVFSFFLVYYSGSFFSAEFSTMYNRFTIVSERLLLYIAPNYANLQENIVNQTSRTFGLRSIYPIIKLITLDTIQIQLPDKYLVDPAYNVGTYALRYYLDYGWAGFIFPPLVIGAFSTYVYTWFLEQPSVESVAIYSIVIAMNSMAFFANYFLRIQYWWYIVIIVAIMLFSRLRDKSGYVMAPVQDE